jgi:anaerobic selenocysteine-containing dehydrogenase
LRSAGPYTGIVSGGDVRIVTSRGSATVPAEIDPRLQDGHVWIPNGFGMIASGNGERLGVNQNELTDTNDRDPFTGVPHHRTVACRIEAAPGPVPVPKPLEPLRDNA